MNTPNMASQPLLDTDPAVAVDIAMRDQLEPGKGFHVDYDLLRDTLTEVEQAEENKDNSALTVMYHPKGSSVLDGAAGLYYPGHSRLAYVKDGESEPDESVVGEPGYNVHVGVDPANEEADQDTLEHELQHYIDDLNGLLKEGAIKRGSYVIGSAAVGASEVLAGSTVGIMASGLAIKASAYGMIHLPGISAEASAVMLPYMERGAAVMLVGTLGALALSAGYWLDGSERRARRTERELELEDTARIIPTQATE